MSHLRHVFLRVRHAEVLRVFAAFAEALEKGDTTPLRPFVDLRGVAVVTAPALFRSRRSARFNVAVDRLLAEALRRVAAPPPLVLETLWTLNAALVDASPPPDGLELWFAVTDFGHGVPPPVRGGEGPSVAVPAELTGLRRFLAHVGGGAHAERAGACEELDRLGALLAACDEHDALVVIS